MPRSSRLRLATPAPETIETCCCVYPDYRCLKCEGAPEAGHYPATVEACAATVDQMAANIQARAQEHLHGIIRVMLEANVHLVGDIAVKFRTLAALASSPAN